MTSTAMGDQDSSRKSGHHKQDSWIVPSWDILFAGRRADVDKNQAGSVSNLPTVKQDATLIASKSQDDLETELKKALEESIPGQTSEQFKSQITLPTCSTSLSAHTAAGGSETSYGPLDAADRLQEHLNESAKLKDSLTGKEQSLYGALLSRPPIINAISSTFDGSNRDEGYEEDSGLRFQPTYLTPRLPIVFAHGLFGFDQLNLAPESLRAAMPGLSFDYWRGITQTLQARGVEFLVGKVPTSATIEERATALRDLIEEKFPHREVNVIGHSMGGLDGRFLISKLESTFTVRSLTTIASPHRGSPFAGFMLDTVIGKERLPKLLEIIEAVGIPGGGRAFRELTTESMANFNERVLNRDEVTYMSWGAAHDPSILHEFRYAWSIIKEKEGANDGMVSIWSSRWGEYRGTLRASHLDQVGWANVVADFAASISTKRRPFDPKILYLTICEDLALRGL